MEMNQKNFKYCDICKEEQAKSLCLQCFSYFCDNCFKYVHDGKKNIDHKKQDIDLYVPIDIWCPEHKKIAINLFCLEEKGNNIIYIIIIIF